MRGRLVKTLLEENQQPGEYLLSWDGKDNTGNSVASGSYIISLTGETLTESKVITFVK